MLKLNRSLARMCTRPFLILANNYSRHKHRVKILPAKYVSSNQFSMQRSSCISSFNSKEFGKDHQICWHCNSSTSSNFCENCHALQPLKKNLDHFQILNIEKSFQINKADLVTIFRKLQNVFHPDKFSIKLEREQALAVEYSSAVNKAFNTLSNPVSRAEYMLSEAGQPISEGEITMDPDFLMDIMEINERLADAEDKETVKFISDKNKDIMDSLIRKVEKCFASNDIEGAKVITAKLKYYYNIYEKVKEFETKHGIFYD